MVVHHERYLNDFIARRNDGLINVVTGIRRCGKSFRLGAYLAQSPFLSLIKETSAEAKRVGLSKKRIGGLLFIAVTPLPFSSCMRHTNGLQEHESLSCFA